MGQVSFFPYGSRETAYLSQKDPLLGAAIDKIGPIERALAPDLFSAVVHHIIGQQISNKALQMIWQRLQDTLGTVNAATVLAAFICYCYGGSPTQLILMANVATSVATPVAGLFIMLMIWRKDVNKGYKKPTVLRICMIVSYLFVLVMTISALTSAVPKLISSLSW